MFRIEPRKEPSRMMAYANTVFGFDTNDIGRLCAVLRCLAKTP